MARRAFIAGCCVGLMAGALAVGATSATRAQDAGATKLGEDPITRILRWKPAVTTPEMPDFARSTRPDDEQLTYTPLSADEPSRPKRKTPAEVAAATRKMDAAAAAARARAATAFPAAHARRPAPAE